MLLVYDDNHPFHIMTEDGLAVADMCNGYSSLDDGILMSMAKEFVELYNNAHKEQS